jgi:hypothetical protein
VCCGTKRLVEISCPPDCGYLSASRQHPPASQRRQHERDVTLLVPAMAGLTERQSQFFFLFQSLVIRHPSDPLRPLLDADVVEAAAAAAGGLETAAKGVIYESQPASVPAQELAATFRSAFAEIAGQFEGPRSALERDAGRALRSVEEAAGRVGPLAGDARRGYIELAGRLVRPEPEPPAAEGRADGSLIVP